MFVALALLVVAVGGLVSDDGRPTTLLVNGQTEVPDGEVHDAVVVLRGGVVVKGTVEGDVLVLDGRVKVTGSGIIGGDLLVVRGRAVLEDGGQVGGDVRTSQPARITGADQVRGDITSTDPLDAVTWIPDLVWFGLWLAAGLGVLAVLPIARRTVADGTLAVIRRPGRAVLLGVVVLVVTPLAIAVLALSLLGSVLALLLAAGLSVAVVLGAAVCAGVAGRLLVPRPGAHSPYLGWLVIGVVLGLAILVSPPLALVVAVGLVTFGVGALVPTRATPDALRSPADESSEAPGPQEQADWGRGKGDPGEWLDTPLDDGATTPEPKPAEPRILAAFPLTGGPDRN